MYTVTLPNIRMFSFYYFRFTALETELTTRPRMANSKEIKVADNILLQVNFLRYAILTLSLPSVSLVWCFLTGIIFQFDEVNETVCKVSFSFELNLILPEYLVPRFWDIFLLW